MVLGAWGQIHVGTLRPLEYSPSFQPQKKASYILSLESVINKILQRNSVIDIPRVMWRVVTMVVHWKVKAMLSNQVGDFFFHLKVSEMWITDKTFPVSWSLNVLLWGFPTISIRFSGYKVRWLTRPLAKSEHQTWLEAENITFFHAAVFFRDTLKTEFVSLLYLQTDWLIGWLINSTQKDQNGKKWLSVITILNFITADFQWQNRKQSLSDRSSLSCLCTYLQLK